MIGAQNAKSNYNNEMIFIINYSKEILLSRKLILYYFMSYNVVLFEFSTFNKSNNRCIIKTNIFLSNCYAYE